MWYDSRVQRHPDSNPSERLLCNQRLKMAKIAGFKQVLHPLHLSSIPGDLPFQTQALEEPFPPSSSRRLRSTQSSSRARRSPGIPRIPVQDLHRSLCYMTTIDPLNNTYRTRTNKHRAVVHVSTFSWKFTAFVSSEARVTHPHSRQRHPVY